MDNVEKRLQAKLIRQITVEKNRQERKYKRNKKKLENGTKKIYYTILKEVIKNKNVENISIDFNEFIDGNNLIPFILCIHINDEEINTGKIYLDFNKLKKQLDYYGFNIEYREKQQYRIQYTENSGLHFLKEIMDGQEYVSGYITKITGKRSIVCDSLLKTDPNQVVIESNSKSKTYTK